MKRLFLHVGVLGLLLGAIMPMFSFSTVSAARFQAGDACTAQFLTFPAWYRGLRRDGDCNVLPPGTGNSSNLASFIFTIVLNIIEIGLQLVAYAAVGYIIYGGFKYLTSAGDPSRVTAGRKIITNALIGLVLSFMSIGIVNLIASRINGSASSTTIDGTDINVPEVDAAAAVAGILNTVYFAAGIVAVIVIIVSAFFYVTSQGDASKIKRAKDGILYSVIGLVIVMVAFLITNFVIGQF